MYLKIKTGPSNPRTVRIIQLGDENQADWTCGVVDEWARNNGIPGPLRRNTVKTLRETLALGGLVCTVYFHDGGTEESYLLWTPPPEKEEKKLKNHCWML